jgi:hypothetical protein
MRHVPNTCWTRTKEEEAEAEAQQVAAVEANQDTNGSNEPYVLAVTYIFIH